MQYSEILNLSIPEMAMLLDALNTLKEDKYKAELKAFRKMGRGR